MDDLCYISFDEKSSNFPYTSRIVKVLNVEHFGDHDTYSCAYYGINSEVFQLYRNAHVLFTEKDEYVPCKVEYQRFDPFSGAHLFRMYVRVDISSNYEEKTIEYNFRMRKPAPKCLCTTKKELNMEYGIRSSKPLDIDRILVNGPATIVWWNDGTKTVVKISEDDIKDDKYDLYTAIAYALAKKHFGTNSAFKRKVARKSTLIEKFFHKEDTNHDHA